MGGEGPYQASPREQYVWDFAAGKLMVAEAGGVTRDLFRGGRKEAGQLDLMGRSQFSACTASPLS